MQVAIIAPSSVPFVWGGAENLYSGLQNYINGETRHTCEIIKIPVAEQDFRSLLTSYRACLDFDVTHFDAIISTKYPSWMAFNGRHVCYMLHKLRGLYDTYHFTSEPEELEAIDRRLIAQLTTFEDKLLVGQTEAESVRAFIEALLQQIALDPNDPQFRFPGPLSRKAIHLLDRFALSLDRVQGHAAISRNVATRRDYFPTAAPVSILYPPPRMSGFRCGSDDYFFTMSRLDRPKRIHLLIEAVAAMRTPVPLLIAGTGPEEARLREIAGGNSNITFLGGIADQQAIDFYANALAIPFIPYDEDYGYITIEAMLSGKPVITVSDAGGPLEFVTHGETGLICPPEVAALTATLEYSATHRQEMRAMGQAARRRVGSIDWQNVSEGLLSSLDNRPANSRILPTRRVDRSKIVVLVTFPVYPAQGGGQTRILNLYAALAKNMDMDIEIVCMTSAQDEGESREIAPGLIQTKVPVSPEHAAAESAMSASVGWLPVTDIAAIDGWELTPRIAIQLAQAVIGARAVVLCHPYLYRCFKSLNLDIPIWYEAQDVEALLKSELLPDEAVARSLMDHVSNVERHCWQEAELVFACTDHDLATLEAIYGHRCGHSTVVPNGVKTSGSPFVAPNQRRALRSTCGFHFGTSALFVGSWHEPNIVAARQIFRVAGKLPTMQFLIVGSVCMALAGEDRPNNVILLGVLDDDTKSLVSNICDIALNPMETGSGSNLKMFDYFSSGIPVISTTFGARGIDVSNGDICFIDSDLDQFELAIVKALADLSLRCETTANARRLVEKRYDWDVIAANFADFIRSHHKNGIKSQVKYSHVEE